MTPEGKGIRPFKKSLNCINQRAQTIERENAAVMGNILKIIVHDHLEPSHPLDSMSDKLQQWRLKEITCRDNRFKSNRKVRSAVLDVIMSVDG